MLSTESSPETALARHDCADLAIDLEPSRNGVGRWYDSRPRAMNRSTNAVLTIQATEFVAIATLEPERRIELLTYSLRVNCSTD